MNLMRQDSEKQYYKTLSVLFLLACFCLLAAGSAWAQSPPGEAAAETVAPGDKGLIEDLIDLLVQKNIMTPREARVFLQRMGRPEEKAPAPAPSGTQQEKFRQLEEQLRQTRRELDRARDNILQRNRLTDRRVDELETKVYDDLGDRAQKSSWAERIKLSGDLRLRYQADMRDSNNVALTDPDNLVDPINTTENQERYRYRARLGLKAKVLDPRDINVGKAEIGLRLATGNENDPISTNRTMGDYQNKDAFVLDRAYVKWTWSPIEQKAGRMPQITLTGGRMANPFFSTDLVWDSDLNFEGFAATFRSDTLMSNSWRAFLTAGAFPMQELALQTHDKWLYGGQVGLEHRPFWGLTYTIAVAYYDFENISGRVLDDETDMYEEDWDWSAPLYRQHGNSWVVLNPFPNVDYKTGLASEFKELSATLKVDVDRFHPVHVILTADYVKNIGYDKDEIRKLSVKSIVPEQALQDETTGYQIGLELGYPSVRAFGEWKFGLFYKYLEADAVVDAFTDSDFHGGGTDAEGHVLRLSYGLFKNIWLDATYMSANEIYQDRENRDNTRLAIDTFQLNLNAAF